MYLVHITNHDRDLIKEALELASQHLDVCRAQHPDVWDADLERCIAGHEYECGTCYARRIVELALTKVE